MEGGPTREFPGDRTFVIGRSQNADFSIPHPNLSREHVRFSLKDGEVWLEDLGSANGTFVQGQRIPPKSSVKLKSHYRVLLGTGSNVVLSFEVVEGYEPLPAPEPKGDVDLPTARERTLAAITRNQQARDAREGTEGTKRHATGFIPAGAQPLTPVEKSNPITKDKTSSKMELDFPQQHFPHEVKKEKMAELRILEAKKQRVLEDIQYKEREVDDLRSKIRTMREESLKLKEQTENFKRDLSEQALQLRSVIEPLQTKKDDLEKCVQELDLIYEEKIDSLETGFRDLKATLEESHSVRMARADKEFKEKTRRLDEEYANKLTGLEGEINSVRTEGERLRDQLVSEKRELEENLRKVRAEAERLEADRKLEQVRIDTEIAKLQGAKLKIENDIESVRREHAKVQSDAARLVEQGKAARAQREEARAQVEEAKKELESLRQTISDVKKSEAKNLERIDELKAHITSLERNAEGISGLIRKAEQDADAVRRQAKDEVEALRRAVKDEVESYRRKAQEAAENERQTIRKNAEAQALAQIQTAEAQAFARTQASESEALARIQTAEAQANARTQSSEQQASQRISSAEAQATARLEKAQEDARTILERAHTEGNAYFETKKRDADEIFATAQSKAHELESGSKNHAERALAEANASLEQRRKTLEAEIAELRRRTDQEIRQVRANALADIENAKDREAKELMNRMRTRVKSIGDQIERVVGSKLTAQFGVTMDPVSMKAFSDEIHQIVETVIGPSKGAGPVTSTSAGEKTLSTIMPVDSHAQERAVKYWKRVGVAAGVFAALGIARIAAPGAFTWLGSKVGSALEVKDNTDAVVKRMLRERQLAMTVVTEQDQRIRDSYTDNILFTEGFIEMKEDVETQKSWTLGLNKFFQSELGLTEKAIVQFGSAEGRMMRDLVEQRKNLVPASKDAGIAKMRETEAGYVKEIKFTLRTDGNWQKYLEYQRDFYAKYTQSFVNRAPANAKGTK
ncbi:MAG: FHA domain-containing protein [Bdellovibrionales bacterium]|nr:FHA domain-containing protein [Bdellovibrionales bacterium]